MLDKDLIHRVMECDQKSKDEEDEICRMALEGAAAIAKIEREKGEVAAVSEFCDDCCFLKLLHDPDSYDWFEDNEHMAVCLKTKTVIGGSLGPFETHNIEKPFYCPKFGRELTKEEEEEAKKRLKWGQDLWKKEVKRV